MGDVLVHTAFDVLAWVAAGAAAWGLSRAGVGACLFGTANLWLSGQPGFARSIEGAIAGGILAVELYKHARGIRLRTGARFALPLAVGVAVGRIGCYLSGLDDFTYGTPTALPWGHDFGDGIARHPVQLYESAAMAAFALVYLVQVQRRNAFVIDNGFYLAVGFYAAQRFLWEFLKPYAPLVGPLTLFHLLSIALGAYAVFMIATAPSAANPKFALQLPQVRLRTSSSKRH